MESSTSGPAPLSQRFTLELEFVLCLSNPNYLQYLALTYPHLLHQPASSSSSSSSDDSDAERFARYLAYLYDYWRTPAYAQYLTHPGPVLRNLELLQQEQFRKDIIRPDVIARLYETGTAPPSALTTRGGDIGQTNPAGGIKDAG